MDPDKAKEEIIEHLQKLVLEYVPESEEEKPLGLKLADDLSVGIDKDLFVCPICIEPVERPQKTSCCNRYVCSMCFARGVQSEVELPPNLTLEEQWDDIDSGRHRYPCCNQFAPRKALFSVVQYDDEDPHEFLPTLVSGMLRAVTPNDGRTGDKVFPFYMKKLRESMWKCTENDCQAIVNYQQRKNHWENKCGRFQTCICCHGSFRISDKHACIDLLNMQINHTESLLERTKRDIKLMNEKLRKLGYPMYEEDDGATDEEDDRATDEEDHEVTDEEDDDNSSFHGSVSSVASHFYSSSSDTGNIFEFYRF